MTNFEAFNKLEEEALSLNLSDPQTKEPIGEPMIVLGIVSAHFGEEWERIARALAEKQITADDYYTEMSRMIREYGDLKITDRIERELLDLYNDQGEFPLTRQGELL